MNLHLYLNSDIVSTWLTDLGFSFPLVIALVWFVVKVASKLGSINVGEEDELGFSLRLSFKLYQHKGSNVKKYKL